MKPRNLLYLHSNLTVRPGHWMWCIFKTYQSDHIPRKGNRNAQRQVLLQEETGRNALPGTSTPAGGVSYPVLFLETRKTWNVKRAPVLTIPLRPGPRQNEKLSQPGQPRLPAPSAPVKAKDPVRDTLLPSPEEIERLRGTCIPEISVYRKESRKDREVYQGVNIITSMIIITKIIMAMRSLILVLILRGFVTLDNHLTSLFLHL